MADADKTVDDRLRGGDGGRADLAGLLSVLLPVAIGMVLAANTRWVCDDAFISFRYAENLIDGLGLVFNDGERVGAISGDRGKLVLDGNEVQAVVMTGDVELSLVQFQIVAKSLTYERARNAIIAEGEAVVRSPEVELTGTGMVFDLGTKTLRMLIEKIDELSPAKRPKLHLVGHSAGSIWHAHLLDRWAALGGPKIENLILFAPACTPRKPPPGTGPVVDADWPTWRYDAARTASRTAPTQASAAARARRCSALPNG